MNKSMIGSYLATALLLASLQEEVASPSDDRFEPGEILYIASRQGQSFLTVLLRNKPVQLPNPTLVKLVDERCITVGQARSASAQVLEGEFRGRIVEVWADALQKRARQKLSDKFIEDTLIPEPISANECSSRAIGLLAMARCVERMGNASGAIEYYREVIIQFPASSQAVLARPHIRALGGTVPSNWEYKPFQSKPTSSQSHSNGLRTEQRSTSEQAKTGFRKRYSQSNAYSPDPGNGPGYAGGYGSGTVFVHGYYRASGTYVHSYMRSAPHR